MRVRDLASGLGAEVDGDPSLEISGMRPLDTAEAIHLAGYFDRRWRKAAKTTRAAAVITSPVGADDLPIAVTRIIVDDPRAAWYAALRRLYRRSGIDLPPPGIDPRSVVDPSAVISAGVRMGPLCYVGPRAELAVGVVLHPGAHVGAEAHIGANSTLLPRATVLDRCWIGADVWLGAGSVVGSPGFGLDERGRLPHVGTVIIEDGVTVGANTCIDRATVGVTRIGAGSHLDNLVQVGHNATVAAGAILCGQVGVAGGAHLGEGVVLGGQSGVVGHVKVGPRARIAAQSGVTRSLAGGETYSGHPAEPNRQRLRRLAKIRRHFDS